MREHPQPPAEVWSRNVRDRVERAPQLVPRDAFGLVDGETIDPIESARVMAVLPLAIACVLNIDDVLRLERRSVKGECLFALVPVDGVALKPESHVLDLSKFLQPAVGRYRPVEDRTGL